MCQTSSQDLVQMVPQSVNIAEQNDMKGKLQKALPWLFWSWCYTLRLELACKDSFTTDLFTKITDIFSFSTFIPSHLTN